MKTNILLLSALLLSATSCHKDKTTQMSMTPEVDVVDVVTDSVLLSKSYPGTLSSDKSVDIVARVNGYLISQDYQSGQMVKRGQVLFRIEDTQYRDAVTQAEAALENAKSTYEYAQRNYSAMERALQSDAVAQIQVIEAKTNMENAAASIKNAQAALEIARTNLGYCTIRAPFDGQMSKAAFSIGAYIGGASQPVTMANLFEVDKMKANFYIDDATYIQGFTDDHNKHLIDYDRVPVAFSDSLPHSYTGKLIYLAPDVDTSTGTILVRLQIDSPYGELKDGMYCTINLPYAFNPKAILVNDAAISTSQTEKYLYCVNDSDMVVYTPIKIGQMANDSMRIVTAGLNGNERYISKALLKVRPGMKVKPIDTK